MTFYKIQLWHYDYRCDNSRTETWNTWGDPLFVDCDANALGYKLKLLNNDLATNMIIELKKEAADVEKDLARMMVKWAAEDTITEEQRTALGLPRVNEEIRQRIKANLNDKVVSIGARIDRINSGTYADSIVPYKYMAEEVDLVFLDHIKAMDHG